MPISPTSHPASNAPAMLEVLSAFVMKRDIRMVDLTNTPHNMVISTIAHEGGDNLFIVSGLSVSSGKPLSLCCRIVA